MHAKNRVPDPTEAEIAAACEQIRNQWSANEKYRRTISTNSHVRVDAVDDEQSLAWYPPVISTALLEMKFA